MTLYVVVGITAVVVSALRVFILWRMNKRMTQAVTLLAGIYKNLKGTSC